MPAQTDTTDTSPRPLKVLQMCAVDFTAKQFLVPLAAGLQRAGYDVFISCSRGSYFDQLQGQGFQMIENPVARNINLFSHAGAIWRTWTLLRRNRFDILHVHTPIAALVGRIAARLAGTPLIIYTAHGFYFHDRMPPRKKQLFVLLEKFGAKFGDFIMTVSNEDHDAAIGLGITTADHVETILNGVDINRFNRTRFTSGEITKLREQTGIHAGSPVIGIVGRLVREKGFFELFTAFKQVLATHPTAQLLVVGDVLPSDYDGSKLELRNHMQQLQIEKQIIFAGMVEDTAPYLAMMDIFCLPSYREGMPVSLLEAMAMSLPAVATDIRGCREEVVEGETGFLIPARTHEPLAEKLTWLLNHTTESASMGQAARRRVEQHFDIQQVVDHQLRIYERLTRGAELK